MNKQAVEALQAKYPILRFFTYSHLPERLQAISRPIGELAYEMASHGGATNDEVAAGLRKLLEAKDCFVRGSL